jgi:hypothetical protein
MRRGKTLDDVARQAIRQRSIYRPPPGGIDRGDLPGLGSEERAELTGDQPADPKTRGRIRGASSPG